MDTSAALRFTETARLLAAEARRHGLKVPGFRSPPRLAGVDRSIRWAPGGSCIVAVRVRGRDAAAVLADLVEGVIVANGLTGQTADGWRVALCSTVAGIEARAA
ncbi:MAG TPA: hypothetical protein VGO92_12895 [Acidimicrobiales bacterium]|nr:hypothetical protein [Acidimicrobiales bacterium]